MASQSYILAACIVVLACANYSTAQQANLTYLGTADGKNFYIDYIGVGSSRNWTGAKEVCEGEGKKLASIETPLQSRVIGSSIYPSSLRTWTAGRDSKTREQFVWDTNKTPLSPAVVTHLSNLYLEHPLTCLAFNAGTFASFDCSAHLFTLCEEFVR